MGGQVMADALQWIGGGLIIAGGLAVIIGAIGLLRLPDVYSRIHAAGVVDTAGVALMILGMICLSPSWLITVKLLLVGIFLFFTSPISGHAIAQVAHDQGIEPMGHDETKPGKTASNPGETDQ